MRRTRVPAPTNGGQRLIPQRSRRGLAAALLQLFEVGVAALHRGVERVERRLLALPGRLELLVDDAAQPRVLREAQARPVRRAAQQELAHRDLVARLLRVEALLAR